MADFHLNWTRRDPAKREGVTVITTIDAHTGGEPLRIVTGGLPELPGDTILERRRYMRDHYDHLRKALMWEPRGHCRYVRGHRDAARDAGSRPGRAFHAQRGLQHHVRPRHHRPGDGPGRNGAIPAKGPQTPVNLDTPAGLVRATAHLTRRPGG